MKTFYFIFLSLLFLTSCRSKEPEQKITQAITTAEAIRDQWQRSRKPLEFIVESEGPEVLRKMGKIGVFAYSKDATVEEQFSLTGVPFRYEANGKFIPEEREVVTGDSTASFYICYPYIPGATPEDTLSMVAPYREYLYGKEVSRSFGESFSVRMRMQCASALLRLRLESLNITDKLHEVSVMGQQIFTCAKYLPYRGEWCGLSGENRPIEFRFDRMMNNYQFVDILLPPVDIPSDITVVVGMNGSRYSLHTTVPRLMRGEMTQLNLMLDASGLKVSSSWVEEQREFCFAPKTEVDMVQIGDYLQSDGTVSTIRDSASVAAVFITDGRHGKAVALRDCDGLKLFSSRRLTSGRIFRTTDGTRKEGIINPSKADGVEEENCLIYKPSLPYPESCALGFTDGCALCSTLLQKYKGGEAKRVIDHGEEMLSELLAVKGTYVPAIAELAHLYYLLQPYAESPLRVEGLELPIGEYLSSSESSDDTFYMFDFSHGVVAGMFPKQFTRLKLRLFYIF